MTLEKREFLEGDGACGRSAVCVRDRKMSGSICTHLFGIKGLRNDEMICRTHCRAHASRRHGRRIAKLSHTIDR